MGTIKNKNNSKSKKIRTIPILKRIFAIGTILILILTSFIFVNADTADKDQVRNQSLYGYIEAHIKDLVLFDSEIDHYENIFPYNSEIVLYVDGTEYDTIGIAEAYLTGEVILHLNIYDFNYDQHEFLIYFDSLGNVNYISDSYGTMTYSDIVCTFSILNVADSLMSYGNNCLPIYYNGTFGDYWFKVLYNKQTTNQDIYNSAYNAGYATGIGEGYAKAQEDLNAIGITENPGTFKDLISSIFMVPVNTLRNILNFEILGYNLGGFIFSILSIVIIFIVVKVIIGVLK